MYTINDLNVNELDDLIISVMSTEYMDIGRIRDLVDEKIENKSGDNSIHEEALYVRCGILLEKGLIEATTYTNWSGNSKIIFRISSSSKQEEIIQIKNLSQSEILCKIAKVRTDNNKSLKKAADSLGIDVRTLQKHLNFVKD